MNQIYIRGNEIATKAYVDSLSLGGDGSALDNYYTKEEVNELIEDNSSTGGNTELTNYYTKEEINNIISESNNSIQVEEMPGASEENVGTIVQYIGVTNENYTTSNFYQVVEKTIINEDGSETTIYVWEEISTPEINLDNYYTKEETDSKTVPCIFEFNYPGGSSFPWRPTRTDYPELYERFDTIFQTCLDNNIKYPYFKMQSEISDLNSLLGRARYGSKPLTATSTSFEILFADVWQPATDYPVYVYFSVGEDNKVTVTNLNFSVDPKTYVLQHTLKASYYNKTEVDSAISTAIAGISTTSMSVITSLPTENISTSTIYLIKDETASTDSDNIYNEYIYINGVWENIGSTKTTVDLSNYYTKEETENKIVELISNIEPGDNNQSSSNLSNYYTKDETDAAITTEIAKINISNYITKTEVLTKNNTEEFTPDSDYEPATKKYVDEAVANAGSGDVKESPIIDLKINASLLSGNLSITDEAILKKVSDAFTKYNKGEISLPIFNVMGTLTTLPQLIFMHDSRPTTIPLNGSLRYTGYAVRYSMGDLQSYLTLLSFDISSDDDNNCTVSSMIITNCASGKSLLTPDNTKSYTPTGNYNPATKKYVDDIVGDINSILDTINGEEV